MKEIFSKRFPVLFYGGIAVFFLTIFINFLLQIKGPRGYDGLPGLKGDTGEAGQPV